MTNERLRFFRKAGVGALICGALALASTASFGGLKSNHEVAFSQIFEGNHWWDVAEGSLGSTRASADNRQYIGCSVKSFATANVGECYAKRADGALLTCTTSAVEHIDTIRAINGQSWIKFTVPAPSGGTCGWIMVDNASNSRPPVP